MTLWTTPDRRKAPFDGGSPGLLFHKWHCYDEDRGRWTGDTKDCRARFLEEVADAARSALAGEAGRWVGRYLERVGLLNGARGVRHRTLWRMVVGYATNPALEVGIAMHPLYGIPWVPGSAVKGLLHAVAERELMRFERYDDDTLFDAPAIRDQFLVAAEAVARLFGSLHLVSLQELPKGAPSITPRAKLEALRAETEEVALRDRLERLLKQSQGDARFYDAVPVPGDDRLLGTDLLNPHYPKYYDSGNRAEAATAGSKVDVYPPSDDQDPRPIQFLAVEPEVDLAFPWRHVPRVTERRTEVELQADVDRIETWLDTALTEWGLGAKTASGYGFFEARASSESAGAEPSEKAEDNVWRDVTLVPKPQHGRIHAFFDDQEAWGPSGVLRATLSEAQIRRLKKGRLRCDVQVRLLAEGRYEIEKLLVDS